MDAATEERTPALPDRAAYLRFKPARKRSADREVDVPTAKRRRVDRSSAGSDDDGGGLEVGLRDMSPLSPDTKFEDIPRYAVLRPCPLVCVNQDIVGRVLAGEGRAQSKVDAIKPIYDEREYEENQQKNSNVLSYRRSMSVSPFI